MRMPRRPGRRLATLGYAALAITDTVLASKGTTTAKRFRYLTKPLLMPALASATVDATEGRRDLLRTGTIAGHAFSWGGDLALMGRGNQAFLTGVGSFFAAHAAYIAAFGSANGVVRRREDGQSDAPRASGPVSTTGVKIAGGVWATTAPVMAYFAGRKDPSLRGPVAAYATILAAMFASSTLLDPTLPTWARRKLVAGTTLFLTSDSILGVREFLLEEDSPALDAAVMATYTAGQFLIASGVASARP